MTIKVISQSTAEQQEETKELFLKVKPLLDNGMTLRQAAHEVTGTLAFRQRWYRELKEYAEQQGYIVRR